MRPGAASAAVTQPPPRGRQPPRPPPSPSAASGRRCSRMSLASPSSSSERRAASSPGCSGGEELGILLLPGDPDPLALAAAQRGVLLGADLGEHALAVREQVELDEVAEELDEDDLALGRVQAGGSGTVR